MITLLLLGAFVQTNNKNLAAARYRFNELALASGGDGIFAMMMGRWAEIYYPAGKSDRRFTVRFGTDDPGKPVRLQYQVLSRGKAKVKMSVRITSGFHPFEWTGNQMATKSKRRGQRAWEAKCLPKADFGDVDSPCRLHGARSGIQPVARRIYTSRWDGKFWHQNS